jgi:uncharacterized protein DUF559
MTLIRTADPRLEKLIKDQKGVLRTTDARAFLTESALRWKIDSGAWQRPCRGVLVTQSGPLTDQQALRAVLLQWGPQAALAGMTAARLDKFNGFGDKIPFAKGPIYLLAPPGSTPRPAPPGLRVIVHRSRMLTEDDVHPLRQPRRTRIARSLVDAADWRSTDRGAMAILAAGVQQGRTRVDDLRAVLRRPGPMRRRGLMLEVLGDIEGGAQALSELDFTRQVIKQFGLPEPSRQAGRRDSRNRQRWIDVAFDKWKVIAEIDGAQHIEPLDQWDDMERDNDFTIDGYRVLRFPAWMVRQKPDHVAGKIRQALGLPG